MIKRLSAIALFCLMALSAFGQNSRQGPFTINSTSGANSCATIAINSQTSASVGIQVTGTWSATLQPEVSIASQPYVNTTVTPTGSTTAQGTIVANGIYNAAVAGFDSFRICATSYASGTATVWINSTNAVASSLLGGGGGGGGTGTPGGSVGQIQTNAGGGNFGGITAAQDATINTTNGNVTVTGINAASVPASATVLGTNSSAQAVAATLSGTGTTVVVNNGPTLIAPVLGTIASGNLAAGTGYVLNNIASATASNTALVNGNTSFTANCAVTGSLNCLNFGETSASTGSGYLMQLTTLANSTLAGLNISMAGATNVDGLTLLNPTAATVGADQSSPKFLFKANSFGSGSSLQDDFYFFLTHGCITAHQPCLSLYGSNNSTVTPQLFNLATGIDLSLSGSSSGSCVISVSSTGGTLNICGNLSVPSTGILTAAGYIISGVTGTSPVCPNGTGGALTTSGCTGSGGGLSGMTAGQVPIAATASTVTSSKAIQGTDTNLLSSGTVSGTGNALCTDASGGATTTGCPSGGFTAGGNLVGSSTVQSLKSIGGTTGVAPLSAPWVIVDGVNLTTIAAAETYLTGLGYSSGTIWSFVPEDFTTDPFVNWNGQIVLGYQSGSGDTCASTGTLNCYRAEIPLTMPTHLTVMGLQNPSRSQGAFNQGTVIFPGPSYPSPYGIPVNATSWTGTSNHIPDFTCASTGGSLSNGTYYVSVAVGIDRTGGTGTTGSTAATITPGLSAPTAEVAVSCANGGSAQSITFHAPTATGGSGSGAFIGKDFYAFGATAAAVNGASQAQSLLVSTQWTCSGCSASHFEHVGTFGFAIPASSTLVTITSIPTLTAGTGFPPPLVDLSTCFITLGTGVPGYSVNSFDTKLEHMTLSGAMGGTNTSFPAANEPSCLLNDWTAEEGSGPDDLTPTGPWLGTTLYEGYKGGNSAASRYILNSNEGPSPAVIGPFTASAMSSTGVVTISSTAGCASNGCAGAMNLYNITGFTNANNNFVNAQAIASSATSIDFSRAATTETHAATVTGPLFYPVLVDGRGIGNGGFRTFEDSTVANRCVGCVYSGTVNTQNAATGGCAANCVTSVSGATFEQNWTGNIGINGTTYTISSVQSTTVLTISTAPGTQSGVSYSVAAQPVEPYSIWMTGTNVGLHVHGLHIENDAGGDGFFVDNLASLDANGITGFGDVSHYLTHATSTADVFTSFETKVGKNGAVSDDSVPFTKSVGANVGYSYQKQITGSTFVIAGYAAGSTSPVCPNGTNGALTTSGCTSGGSGTVGTGTIDGVAYYTGTTTVGSTTPPTVNGLYYTVANVTAGAAVAPTQSLAGVPIDATNPATLLYSDRANYVNWSAGTAMALPAIATNFASNFPFVLKNTSTTLTITPNAGASNLIDGSATGTIIPNFAAFVYSDTAGPNWYTVKFPTFAAFGSTCGTALDWSTSTGIGCVTLTTTGTSGAATFSGGTLNIPQYSGSGGTVTSVTTTSPITGCSSACTSTATLGLSLGQKSETTTYQVLAADFSTYTTLTVPSGTFTITLVASGTQPANGTWINILNYGTGVVTVARSGQNINGVAGNITLNAGSATAPTSTQIFSDGTNYEASIDEATVGTVTSIATTGPLGGGTITGSGTLTCSTCVTSAASLTNNALMTGAGLQASQTVTTGTGVLTALGTNTGTAGAFVVNGGALGTPSGGTLTSATGYLEQNLTGASAAGTITEGGSTFSVTRAGVSTANLTAPWVIQNTNSTNNNTSITLGITAPGTSTGQTVLNINGAATGGDLADFGTGGTWTAGTLSGQTILASVLVTGAIQTKGTTAGFVDYAQGSTSASVAPCNTANSICDQAPTAVTAGVRTLPPALAQGMLTNTGSSSALTQGYSGDANHSTTVSWSTATTVGSTSLCSSTFCPAGTYRVSAYIDVTTACTTTGAYVVNLIWTDDTTVSKTSVLPLVGLGVTPTFGPTALTATLVPTSTTDFGTASFILRSTGTTSINYSTTATACATGGPGVGKLYLTVEPIQ